jgi:hypothetical protein
MQLKRKPLGISHEPMNLERSDKAHEWWLQSSERFDYFITGLAGALAGYIGKSASLVAIGFNQATLEVVAASAFVASFVFGLRRIEFANVLRRLTSDRLYHHAAAEGAEEASWEPTQMKVDYARGELWLPEQLKSKAQDHRLRGESIEAASRIAMSKAYSAYKWRDRLLIGGMIALIGSRILPIVLP